MLLVLLLHLFAIDAREELVNADQKTWSGYQSLGRSEAKVRGRSRDKQLQK